MRVFGELGAALGRLEAIERNAATGRVTSLTVRHGLFGRKHTRVPANRVKQVNKQSVQIEFSPDDFYRLPLVLSR
jgi:sporulation protein YlmC with PRC-barrel domain